jgi:hypothetical protein
MMMMVVTMILLHNVCYIEFLSLKKGFCLKKEDMRTPRLLTTTDARLELGLMLGAVNEQGCQL